MSDSVLRHCASPSVDADQKRISREPDYFLKVFSNNAENFFIGCLDNLFVARAANETAEESTILRSPMGKLVVYKGGGQHAFAFAARPQKAESGRQRRAHISVVAEIYSDR